MKYLCFALLIGIVLFTSCKGRNINPSVGSIDVLHQKIDLQFDWDEKKALGYTEIEIKSNQDLDTIFLDAKELIIENIKLINGKKLEFLNSKKDNNKGLQIILDRTYRIGEELVLTIDYETKWINQSDPNNISGSFGKGIRFFKPSLTEKERRKQAWAFGEPNSSKYWFPCNDNPKDLRTTEFIATVRNPLMIISNGFLKETIDNNDGTKTFHWETDIPYANHLSSFTVGEYSNYKQEYEGVKINNYGYPDESIGTKESVIGLPKMMKFYSDYTGVKYPYPEYSQIFVQDFGGWKGNMMSSTITENMIDDKTTHEDFYFFWDAVEGEALAFQWFGNYVKPSGWKDTWLAKAFCRHLYGIYNQSTNGNEEYQIYQHNRDLNVYLSDWYAGKPTIIVPDHIEDLENYVNSNIPNKKGALVLNMLRNEMGEAKWQELLKDYMADFGNKFVTTKDFINLVNEINGSSLDWFFQQWVYGVGHPEFKLSKTFNKDTKKLRLALEQIQKVDSLVGDKRIPFFKGKIEVEIDGKIQQAFIEAKKENTLEFLVDSEPKLINFDYQDVWIKESEFEKTNKELLKEFTETEDIIHRVNTMYELTDIAIDSTTNADTRNAIISEIFDIADSKMQWRNRLFALWQLHSLFSEISSDDVIRLSAEQEEKLLHVIENSKSWVKASAINFLGDTREKKHVQIYLDGLNDYSDRVTFMAAIALGKSNDPRAFDALMNLPKKPSWKNQSLISAMYGLKELKDPRALDFTLKTLVDSNNPHWNLATQVWDHRLAAAYTLVALGKTDKGYPLILDQFNNAMNEGNVNDIFYNTQLVSILGDKRGVAVFDELNEKFKDDENALDAIKKLQKSFNNSIKN